MAKIKITFLGTGPSGRIPRRGCTRPSCRDARHPGSRSRRLQSSVLIETADTAVLFDVTQDILKQWHHAAHIKKLDAIFISHPHSDAMGGVPYLGKVLAELGESRVLLYAERETIDRITQEHPFPTPVRPRPIKPGSSVTVGSVRVHPFRVEHTLQKTHPTLGFDIHIGGRRIVLMSDVKRVSPRLLSRLAGPDLCIMDCAIYTSQFPTHVNFREAQAILQRLAPRQTILTQIGVGWPPYAAAHAIVRSSGPHIDIAYDGLTVMLR